MDDEILDIAMRGVTWLWINGINSIKWKVSPRVYAEFEAMPTKSKIEKLKFLLAHGCTDIIIAKEKGETISVFALLMDYMEEKK